MEHILNALPEKGKKRADAISQLTDHEALLHLIAHEKAKCKKAALSALANMECEDAIVLWEKLIKHKNLGEDILMPACSDTVSEVVGGYNKTYFQQLLQQPADVLLDPDQFDRFTAVLSVMFSKGSPAMLEVYRLIAANRAVIEAITFGEKKNYVHMNDELRMWEPLPQDNVCIIPLVLTVSIMRSMDERLIMLSKELYEQYGQEWLIPYFCSRLLTDNAEEVFEQFSPLLQSESLRQYVWIGLGRVYYNDQNDAYMMSAFWGRYSYGSYDNRSFFQRELAEKLDDRWLKLLIEEPQLHVKVKFQTYNRTPVSYESYKQLVLDLMPKTITDPQVTAFLNSFPS